MDRVKWWHDGMAGRWHGGMVTIQCLRTHLVRHATRLVQLGAHRVRHICRYQEDQGSLRRHREAGLRRA